MWLNSLKSTTITAMETQSFMRNFSSDFLSPSLAVGGRATLWELRPRAVAGSFNLDFFPKACPGQARSLGLSSGFRIPFTASERRKGPLALMATQFSIQTSVLASPRIALLGAGLGFQAQILNLWAIWVSTSAEQFFGARC